MKNKYLKKIIIFIIIFLAIIFTANIFISNLVENKLTELLLKNNSEYYTTTLEKVKFNLLERSISVNGLVMKPTDLSISELKRNDSISKELQKISLSSVKLNGIHFYKTIINKEIEVNELELNDLIVQKLKNPNSKKIKFEKKSFNLDSIYIDKINGFQINKIDINNISYQIVDIISNDTIFQHKPLSINLDGFKLNNYYDHYFKIEPIKDQFEINDVRIHLTKKQYTLDIKAIHLDFDKEIISIKNIRYKPTMDLVALSKTYKYNDAALDFDIENIKIFNYDLHKTVKNEGLFIDSILVSGMKLDIFKDKSKPWNPNKIKTLPNVALKHMDLPLYINKIKIENSLLKLEENFGNKDLLLKLALYDINAQITNITSIKEFREQPMKIVFRTHLMNRAPLKANFIFPLKDNQTTFYFNGSLGATKFKYFDEAIFPVLGLKILKGDLQSLVFSANADNISSNGKMTMLYDDLEAKIFKSKSNEKNKFLSWSVNKIIHNSNPGKKKKSKIRIAEMHYNRINIEGFGSYLWKTLQSGITNTIAPGGKTIGKIQTKKDKKARNKKRK